MARRQVGVAPSAATDAIRMAEYTAITDGMRTQFTPNAPFLISGEKYAPILATTADSLSALTVAANTAYLLPWVPPVDCTIDQMEVNVIANVAASNIKFLIYSVDLVGSGAPTTRAFMSADVSTATTGVKTTASSPGISLSARYMCWVGYVVSHAIGVSSHTAAGLRPLGAQASTAVNHYTGLARGGLTYATGPPDPWALVAGDLATAIRPAIRFRIA